MKWQDTLIRVCHKIVATGGEVKIKFSYRQKKGQTADSVVPIISSYPNNQIVCDEIHIEIDD